MTRKFFNSVSAMHTFSNRSKNSWNQLGTWYMFNGKHKISEKFALETMAH
ncbi:MAG: hypothetical protein HC798_03260, partial [Polaribacter sp.]|nr:hypothetical protein [Polaribacter sp.]